MALSGPSTNLLETEKQSPRLPVTEDDDSYFKLSTQAAAIKAQLSFQNEYITPRTDSKVQKSRTTNSHAANDNDIIEAQLPAQEFRELGLQEGETVVLTPRKARVFVDAG